jgi:5-formyltetrahydrofolate cyclo-ligase
MTKSELRKTYLAMRRDLSPGQIEAASRKIAENFFRSVDLSSASHVHTFVRSARHNEIDTSKIYFRIWRDHPKITVSVPRIDTEANLIDSVPIGPNSEWAENAWGIREPLGADHIATDQLDIVIVPLLIFDKAGHRVGYGKGFYDGLLARCRADCRKIGVSYFAPVDRVYDVSPLDVPLEICVTPHEVFRFSSGSTR